LSYLTKYDVADTTTLVSAPTSDDLQVGVTAAIGEAQVNGDVILNVRKGEQKLGDGTILQTAHITRRIRHAV